MRLPTHYRAACWLRLHVLLLVFIGYLGFSERIYLRITTGGRGLLPVLEFALPVAVLLLIVGPRLGRAVSELLPGPVIVFWGPYLLLSAALPLAGVAFGDYPIRSTIDVLPLVVLPLSLVILGAWLSRRPEGPATLHVYVHFLIVLEAVWAVGVLLGRFGFIQSAVLDGIMEWDLQTQQAYAPGYALFGRGIGTFINPNVLGFWAVLSFWYAALLLRGWRRSTGAGFSLLALVASQSRGALFAMVGSGLIPVTAGLFRYYARGAYRKRHVVWLAAIVGLVVVVGSVLASHPRGEVVLERYRTGAGVLIEGVEFDANLAARVDAWHQALDRFAQAPAGTLGSPELVLGGAVDNEYIRLLVQGGLIYLLVYLWALWGGIRLWARDVPAHRFVALASVSLAVEALVATPMTYPPVALLWLVLGVALTPSGTRPVSSPSPGTFPDGFERASASGTRLPGRSDRGE